MGSDKEEPNDISETTSLEHIVDNPKFVIDPDCCFDAWKAEKKVVEDSPNRYFCSVTFKREGITKGLCHIVKAYLIELGRFIRYRRN
jgi:hypothetical protein